MELVSNRTLRDMPVPPLPWAIGRDIRAIVEGRDGGANRLQGVSIIGLDVKAVGIVNSDLTAKFIISSTRHVKKLADALQQLMTAKTQSEVDVAREHAADVYHEWFLST